uniref:Uncharacterized protein n=1 Tax=Siphoviridae sp. ct3b712 TaxID=2826283 RepID=A0A8S5M3Q7_9CAUD|nr:MAG TPA: hypothetical protein [Siphoviridae sp. ct3b712]
MAAGLTRFLPHTEDIAGRKLEALGHQGLNNVRARCPGSITSENHGKKEVHQTAR